MKAYEINLLNKSFKELDKTKKCLKKKKPFIEGIGEGEALLIDDIKIHLIDNTKVYGGQINYVGVVDCIASGISYHDGIFIPVNFQQGKCKIFSFDDGRISFGDAEPAYEGAIKPSSILHKGKDIIDKVLKKKYKTSLKEIGLE